MDTVKTFILTTINTALEISKTHSNQTSSIQYRPIPFDSVKTYTPNYKPELRETTWQSLGLSRNPVILLPFNDTSQDQIKEWTAVVVMLSSILNDSSIVQKLSYETLISNVVDKLTLETLKQELYETHEGLKLSFETKQSRDSGAKSVRNPIQSVATQEMKTAQFSSEDKAAGKKLNEVNSEFKIVVPDPSLKSVPSSPTIKPIITKPFLDSKSEVSTRSKPNVEQAGSESPKSSVSFSPRSLYHTRSISLSNMFSITNLWSSQIYKLSALSTLISAIPGDQVVDRPPEPYPVMLRDAFALPDLVTPKIIFQLPSFSINAFLSDLLFGKGNSNNQISAMRGALLHYYNSNYDASPRLMDRAAITTDGVIWKSSRIVPTKLRDEIIDSLTLRGLCSFLIQFCDLILSERSSVDVNHGMIIAYSLAYPHLILSDNGLRRITFRHFRWTHTVRGDILNQLAISPEVNVAGLSERTIPFVFSPISISSDARNWPHFWFLFDLVNLERSDRSLLDTELFRSYFQALLHVTFLSMVKQIDYRNSKATGPFPRSSNSTTHASGHIVREPRFSSKALASFLLLVNDMINL